MPALIATITGNAKPFQGTLKRTLQDVEDAAKRGAQLTSKHFNAGAMRELLVLFREIGRGNWTRVPGSLSILASRLNLLKLLFNPVTIGLVAFGTAAFFVVRHIFKLNEEAKNLADIMDNARVKFSDQAAAMKQAAEHAQAFRDWLNALGKAQEGLAEKTEEALKALKEQARFERELAAEKGAGKKKLAEMDIAEAEKELAIVTRSRLEAQKRVELDKLSAGLADRIANNPERSARIKQLGEKSGLMAKIVDAIQEKMKIPFTELISDPLAGDMGIGMHQRAATKNDVFEVSVEGKQYRLSLAQAQKDFASLSKQEQRLAAVQKQLSDLAEHKKTLTAKDVADQKKLQHEERELRDDIALKKQFLPQIAENAGGHLQSHLTGLQQQGAYAGRVAMLDIQHKIHHELKGIHGTLQKQGARSGRLGEVNYGK